MRGGKLSFLAAALLLMLLNAGAPPLYAGDITFVFTGVGTGTIGGVGFTDAAFTITSVGDTSAVYAFAGDTAVPTIDSTTATINISGVGLATITEATRVFNNRDVVVVGLNSFVRSDLYNIGPDASLATYDLVTSFGPIFNAWPYPANQFQNVATSLGLLSFSSYRDGTFEAITGVVGTTPPVVSSLCGPQNPAPISGSTGAQGVLDPANTDSSQGLVWPPSAVQAGINMETGQVNFLDSAGNGVGSAVLPGVSGTPAFPAGKLHFISVRLPAGKQVAFNTLLSGLQPPIIVLSCQDVIWEAGSSLTVGAISSAGPVPAAFLGASGGQAGGTPAGFGPRSGSFPAAGSLYPPLGGAGGNASGTLAGGGGGPAVTVAAARRITLNGFIAGGGLPAATGSSSPPAQGGGGGAVRLAAVLVEGAGGIGTAGGPDSDGTVRSPSGPIEIQAFVQDLFTGTATVTPIRGNPVVAPVPENLPTMEIVSVDVSSLEFFASDFLNTGSLSTPDVTLPEVSAPVAVSVRVDTFGVPEGTLLTFRAVGTGGSVATDSDTVTEGVAFGTLSLSPGETYQVVVYPEAAFDLARGDSAPVPQGGGAVYAAQGGGRAVPSRMEPGTDSSVERWARLFGAELEAHRKLAQLRRAE